MVDIPDSVFVALEYDDQIPKLDLHGTKPEEVETAIFNFLTRLHNLGMHNAQVIFGRGGAGVLKQKTIEFLNENLDNPDANMRLVKAWKEARFEGAGGRCLVVLIE